MEGLSSVGDACTFGGLFHNVVQEMKNGMPLWEDLISKATKLHSSLKATILAVTAYLDAFQKIADAATNTRGATRDIGTALTRICFRHKAVEARMKTFTSTIMEFFILPLQDKVEEWKKSVINLDKEHARNYKRAKSELKKRSTETLRLQKKVRKGTSSSSSGPDLHQRLQYGLKDVTERRNILEQTEKNAVKAALIEERSRFCTLFAFLKPVFDEEIAMLIEMEHLQEACQQLEKHTADPYSLPMASEQVIDDLKSSVNGSNWTLHTITPSSSPTSSLGSRKSSMCSISSYNSSSSTSSKCLQQQQQQANNHQSSSASHWQRPLYQSIQKKVHYLDRNGTVRYVSSATSRDSGFTSQDTLYPRPQSVIGSVEDSNLSDHSNGTNTNNGSSPVGGPPPITTSTWPNLQETIQFERAASAIMNERPHTISSAYEKGHQRSPLTVYTFHAPGEQSHSQPVSPVSSITVTDHHSQNTAPPSPAPSLRSLQSKPPLPIRCSSLEKTTGPNVPAKPVASIQGVRVLPTATTTTNSTTTATGAYHTESVFKKPSGLPPHLSNAFKTGSQQQSPTYANMYDLLAMNSSRQNGNQQQQQISLEFNSTANDKPAVNEGMEKDGSTSESSLESSSGYGSQTTFPVDEHHQQPQSANHAELLYGGGGTLRNVLLRSSNARGPPNKPPPPIRRTSSISNTSGLGQSQRLSQQSQSPPSLSSFSSTTSLNSNATMIGSSMETLPPPPAFLLDPSTPPPTAGPPPSTPPKPVMNTGVKVAQTVKALNELKHTPASPNSVHRFSTTASHFIYPESGGGGTGATGPTATSSHLKSSTSILSNFHGCDSDTKQSYVSQSGGVIYAQPSQILNFDGGTGGGGSSTTSTTRRVHSFRSQSAENRKSGGSSVGGGFLATLSAKWAPNLSPRSLRRHNQDFHQPAVASSAGNRISGDPTTVVNRSSGAGQHFLQSINARLSQQHLDNVSLSSTLSQQLRATRIRQIINRNTQPDPSVCHDSLMDQIKRGASLRRVKTINDRSAPKIY